MQILSEISLGISVAFSFYNLLYCFIGAVIGTAIGVLPGVGPLVTISVLLPITFGLPPEGAIIMLAGIYYGSAYGGSITAILVNLPGESSSAITCLDGYQRARQGRAGAALATAAVGSLVAGIIGTLLVAVVAVPLANVALRFGPSEYFSLVLMALVFSAVLVDGQMVKGIAMALIGVLLGLVGTDVNSGVSRFTFGIPNLIEGLDFTVIAVGLFAFAEIAGNLERVRGGSPLATYEVGDWVPRWKDLKASFGAMLRGTTVGSVFGILPGAGLVIASFAAYAIERKVSRNPDQFGNGAIQGVAAPEAANNAAAQTAFIPTLTLGVPGSGTMAVMMGALMIHGINPGPQILTLHAPLFWGLVISMLIGNFILVILNLPLIRIWVQLLRIPYNVLYPAIIMFSCIGIYSVTNNPLGVYLAAGLGVVGHVFHKLSCPVAPLILGFVLGPLLEENFRRAMMFSRGSLDIFVTSPISASFLAIACLLLVLMVVPNLRHRKDQMVAEGDDNV